MSQFYCAVLSCMEVTFNRFSLRKLMTLPIGTKILLLLAQIFAFFLYFYSSQLVPFYPCLFFLDFCQIFARNEGSMGTLIFQWVNHFFLNFPYNTNQVPLQILTEICQLAKFLHTNFFFQNHKTCLSISSSLVLKTIFHSEARGETIGEATIIIRCLFFSIIY